MTDSHVEAVVRQVHAMLAAQVDPNVTFATYGGDLVPLATLPAVVLYLPRLRRHRTEADNQPEQTIDQAAGTVTTYRPPRVYDLVFRYELVADPITATRLIEGVAFFLDGGILTVERPALGGGTELAEYRILETEEPAPAAGDGEAHRIAGQFAVVGVEIRQAAGTTAPAATTIVLTLDKKEE